MALKPVRMEKGLHNNVLEEVTSPRHGVVELEDVGLEDIEVSYPRATKRRGRFTLCVIRACTPEDPDNPFDVRDLEAGGIAMLAEGDQPNAKIGKTLAKSRAVENMLEEFKAWKKRKEAGEAEETKTE
jgi:hypothetical protein